MKKMSLVFFFYLIIHSSQSLANDIHLKYLASSCSTCHGTSNEHSGSITSLAGYDKKKFLKFFSDLLKSKDTSSVMYQIARGYSKKEILLMADFFSEQK